MDELEAIWRKAQKLAIEAEDAEVMQKAVETARIAHELQGKVKEQENKWIRSAQSWTSIVSSSTAAFAVVISFVALAFQFYQFKTSSSQQEDAAETAQWRDALKAVSLKDDSSVLSSAVQMQSFFGLPRFSRQARSVAAMLLPCVTSGAGFDAVVHEMRILSDKANQRDLLAVQQAIIDEDWDLYNKSRSRKPDVQKTFADFLEDPTDMIADDDQFLPKSTKQALKIKTSEDGQGHGGETECEQDRQYNPRKRALTCSYNTDTISHELARLWREHADMQPGRASISLSGIVLENANFVGIDFSNISMEGIVVNKSDMSGAKLNNIALKNAVFRAVVFKNAVLTGLQSFEDSKWDGTDWWDAQTIDCPLADYLHRNFPATAKSSALEQQALVRWNCSGKSQ